MRGLVLLHAWLVAGLIMAPAALCADVSATQPAIVNTADLIEKLGDPDSLVRDRAEHELWEAGIVAIPVLKSAAQGDDPEVATRARRLLLYAHLGLTPASPPQLRELLQEYHGASIEGKLQAVAELTRMGQVANHLLCWLWLGEAEPVRSEVFRNFYGASIHAWASAVIADGDAEAIARLIEQMARSGDDQSTRDAVAYHFIRGTLPAKLAEVRRRFDVQESKADATFLIYAYRAQSDLKEASILASRFADKTVQGELAVERGDWTSALQALGDEPPQSTNGDYHALRAAYARLAGDQAVFEREMAVLDKSYRDSESTMSSCFLNDAPAKGMAALPKAPAPNSGIRRDESNYMTLLCEQLRFGEAEDYAGDLNKTDIRLMLPLARRLYYFGSKARAIEIFDALSANALSTKYPGACATIAMSLHKVGLDDRARQLACETFRKIAENDDCLQILRAVVPADVNEPQRWWELLRKTHPDDPPEQLLARLTALLAGKLPMDETREILQAAQAFPVAAGHLDRWVADTVRIAGSEGIDDSHLEQYATQGAASETFQTLGDILAEKGQWERAASAYERAWSLDRTGETLVSTLNLALQGHALQRAGHPAEGQALMDRARQMDLAGDQDVNLVEGLRQRGMEREAERQEEIAIRTGRFDSFIAQEALSRRAEKLAAADPLTAAAMNERRIVEMLRSHVTFINAAGFIAVPRLTHVWRAQGLQNNGDVEGAIREWKLALEYVPNDADAASNAVILLDKAGRKKEADAIYIPVRDALKALCERYPQSGAAHNNLAWLAARSRRDLDLALAESTRSLDLQLENAAYIDTLAEVHLARGDKAGAEQLRKKAVDLSPKLAR